MAAASTALGRQDGDSASSELSSGALEFGARPDSSSACRSTASASPASTRESVAGRQSASTSSVSSGKAHSFFVHASIALFSSYRQKTSALLQRAKFRNANELPRCKKSSTDGAKTEPSLASPRMLTELLRRANDRKLKLLPRWRKSSTLSPEAKRANDRKLKLLPK